MTLIAFGRGLLMVLGFTNRDHVVVAAAAIIEDLRMIDIGQQVEPEGRVTTLAQIAGGGVQTNFRGHRIDDGTQRPAKSTVVTIRALG